jgi:mono/diheme cytochrome c family protein
MNQRLSHSEAAPAAYKVMLALPVSECAGCHMANIAKADMTWVQFYPLLRDK